MAAVSGDVVVLPVPRRHARLASSQMVRHVALLALLVLSIHFVLPQITRAGAAVGTVGAFQWKWLPAVVLASSATYAMAALSLAAASGQALGFGRNYAAQFAAAFTNRLLPAGVGAMATNVRYLERAGSSRADAVTAVGLDSVAGVIVHAVALVAVASLFGATHQHFGVHAPDVPDNWALLASTALVLSAAGVAIGAARLRGRFRRVIGHAVTQLTALGRDPGRAVRLLAASAGVTSAYALALCAAVQATGGGLPLLSIVAVYLGGSALAAAAPTPGGLGAVEAGLIAGLTSVGQPAAAAVTAVLVFRLVTYWAPVVPGAVSFWALRRAGTI
jgi:undecaprenyl-diphosphatase